VCNEVYVRVSWCLDTRQIPFEGKTDELTRMYASVCACLLGWCKRERRGRRAAGVEVVCVCICVCNCVCACMCACVSVCVGGWLSGIGVGKVECAPEGPFWSIFRVPQSNQPRFYFCFDKQIYTCTCVCLYKCIYMYTSIHMCIYTRINIQIYIYI